MIAQNVHILLNLECIWQNSWSTFFNYMQIPLEACSTRSISGMEPKTLAYSMATKLTTKEFTCDSVVGSNRPNVIYRANSLP